MTTNVVPSPCYANLLHITMHVLSYATVSTLTNNPTLQTFLDHKDVHKVASNQYLPAKLYKRRAILKSI